jgi:hypothetical protein
MVGAVHHTAQVQHTNQRKMFDVSTVDNPLGRGELAHRVSSVIMPTRTTAAQRNPRADDVVLCDCPDDTLAWLLLVSVGTS